MGIKRVFVLCNYGHIRLFIQAARIRTILTILFFFSSIFFIALS